MIEEGIIEEPKKGLLNWINNFVTSNKSIGQLNGKWASAFKLLIMLSFLCIPTFFAWATWVTTTTWNNTNAITNIATYVEHLPPPEGCTPSADWRRRIEVLENNCIMYTKEIIQLDRTNATEHSQILILLEGIKTKLELISDKQYE